MIDRPTKIILGAIAVGLWINGLMPLFHPKSVGAMESFSCTGDLKANAWGGVEATIGGYKVELKCR